MISTPGIGHRTDAERLRQRFGAWLAQGSGNRVRLTSGDPNPWARITDRGVLGTTDTAVELSAVVIGAENFDTSVAAMAFANAVKEAGNPRFSATRIANAFPQSGDGCGAVDTLGAITSIFGDGEYVTRVCISYQRATGSNASPPAGGVTDTVLSTVGHAAIRDSSQPAEIGQRVPSVGDKIPSGLGSVWDSIPTSVKVGGGVTLLFVAALGAAYVWRSFK